MEQAQTQLNELKSKLEYFFMFKFDEWLQDRLIVINEKVTLVVLERPQYDKFDRHFYASGLLKVGKKYIPLTVEASDRLILIKAKPFYWTITWEELEKEVNNQ